MLLLCSLTGLFAFLHILKATSYFINKLWQRSVTSWKNPLEAVSSGWIQPPPGNANLRKVPEALQASKMPLDERNTSESVINGTINFNKYSLLAEKWHKTSCNILGLAPLHLCQLGLWQGAHWNWISKPTRYYLLYYWHPPLMYCATALGQAQEAERAPE